MTKTAIQPVGSSQNKKFRTFVKNIPYLILIAPAVIYLLIFNYLPMGGIVIAFKNFNYNKGIFKSEWCGFDNFVFFFTSQDALRVTKNTVLYSLAFIILGIFAAVTIALLLYEIRSKSALKVFQTSMILPHFLSWVVVAYIVYVLFNPTYGIVNNIITTLGGKEISWYSEPKYWPFILIAINIWKTVGLSSIIYYASLMGIDDSLFEAAELDGAGRMKQIIHISIPSLIPIICIMLIMNVGNIMRGDFGLFYQVPMDVGVLYPYTDIIDTYIYRGLRQGNIGISSAVGLFQSVVGFIMVVATNAAIKKINSENSMF